MTRLVLPLFLAGCAMQPPAPPPPPPTPQFVVPAGTEFVSDLFGYSQAVRVGPWVTTSAIPGFDIEKRGFPEDYESQVRAAFANLKLVLEAAGATLNEVVELQTQQLDMEQFNATIDGKMAAFGEHKPTWTAIGVKSLPLPSMQFQVSARAWSPNGKVVTTPAAGAGGAEAPVADQPAAVPSPPAEPPKPKQDPPSPFTNRPGY
jgi:enamine deaminase RidA (YjgF/YER057c/UK114 family)